ncbi:MAG TPA: hypothetical protein VIV60_26035, partial [Polyangiaceae bacterium]
MKRRTPISLCVSEPGTDVLPSLWRDTRGIAYIEQLIVVGCCALAGITAFRGLSGAIGERAEAQG